MPVVVEEEEIDPDLHRVHHLFLQLAQVEVGELHLAQAADLAVLAELMVAAARRLHQVLPALVAAVVGRATVQARAPPALDRAAGAMEDQEWP
jgi:hypothetical protein